MVEKSTVDKKQPDLYPKLKRVDPRILKRAIRIEPDVEAADRARLDQLAELGEGPKVLSIYVNLDPGQFPTPRQRQSEVVSLVDQAAKAVEEVEDENDRKELLRHRGGARGGHPRAGRRRSGPPRPGRLVPASLPAPCRGPRRPPSDRRRRQAPGALQGGPGRASGRRVHRGAAAAGPPPPP